MTTNSQKLDINEKITYQGASNIPQANAWHGTLE